MVCEDPFASENSVTVCTSRSAWLSHRSDSMHQVLYDGHDEHCLYVSFQPGLDVRYVMRGFGDIENADHERRHGGGQHGGVPREQTGVSEDVERGDIGDAGLDHGT
jgi:hypothetical protein